MSRYTRKGTHALTERFKAKYREKAAREDARKDKSYPLPNTPEYVERYHAALKAIGIESGKALGDYFGLGRTRGAELYKDPSKLTAERAQRLRLIVENPYWDKESEYRFMTKSGAYDYAEIEAERNELAELWNTYSALDPNQLPDGYAEALQEEYRLRALTEGYGALTDGQRETLLSIMGDMLRANGSERGALIADSLERIHNGRRATSNELSGIVASERGLSLSELKDKDDEVVYVYETGEYGEQIPVNGSSAADTVLREYAGISEE